MQPAVLLRAIVACSLIVGLTATAGAELHPRLDGAAAYDDVLGITWLTDAGLSGSDSWDNQLAWIEGLNNANYLGFSDWRLASMSVASGLPVGMTTSVFDCDTVWEPLCRDNELSYMFYYNLGGELSGDLTGDQAVGDVILTNIQPVYWSGTEFAAGSAWIIHFDSGFGVWSFKSGNRYAWAVRLGDVGTVADDADADGVLDATDNCIEVENAAQLDTDSDGYGNACDADLTNDCFVGFFDLARFAEDFGTSGTSNADFDNDDFVGFSDLSIFGEAFGSGPGPSGLATSCD